MKTFKDIQVGDALVGLYYNATDNTYSKENNVVTAVKKSTIEYQNTNFKNGLTHTIRVSDWSQTSSFNSYYDSSDALYIFTDVEAARNFLTSTRDNFLANINATISNL